MAARRVAKSTINWAAIAERVPSEQKPQYLLFKAKVDQNMRKVVALPEHPPKIDWAAYKSKVPIPGMVEEFQKKFESFKIPLPEDSAVLATIAAEEKEAVARVQKFKQESEARRVGYEGELKKQEGKISLSDMTMEEFAYYYPDQALDPINRPTYWPHRPEDQPGPDDEKDSHGH